MSLKIKWLIAGISLLIAANVVLYVQISHKDGRLDKARYDLADLEPFEDCVKSSTIRADYIHKEISWPPTPNAQQFQEAAAAFRGALDVLDSVSSHFDGSSNEDYFNGHFAVDRHTQERLWSAHSRLQQALVTLMELEHAKRSAFRDVFERKKQAYKDLLATMEHAPVGYSKTFDYPLEFPGAAGYREQFRIRAVKYQDSIHWDKPIKLISNYLELINHFMAPFHREDHTLRLNKLKVVFAEKGKLFIYGKAYELNSISPAELRSVYKHINLLLLDVYNSFSRQELDTY